jgi:Fe-S oxidoreductase
VTTTYDPRHAKYLDEVDVRGELARVFDVCNGCRRCVDLCSAFPTMFAFVDRNDRDAGRMTPAQQDQVVDECLQCTLCALDCPYTPTLHEWAVDVPRLMRRAAAMRHATGQGSVRARAGTAVMARTDLVGKVATRTAPLTNRLIGAERGSVVRRIVEMASGVSAQRLVPSFTKVRFSTWFRKRPKVTIAKPTARVAVFPTCVVEYQQPSIGQGLVRVYERNGIECTITSGARCCGAPWLHAGDVDAFAKVARKNVAALASAVRAGNDIVVPQPTCAAVLRHDYADHLDGPDATLVAEHTSDACEYLMVLHDRDGTRLDTDFGGTVPARITHHEPCHLRAQRIGSGSRELMELTGARVTTVRRCSGTDGMWGLRSENAAQSLPMAQRLAEEIERAEGEVVVGDCHLANTAITEQAGRVPLHPLEIVARAYGIAADDE